MVFDMNDLVKETGNADRSCTEKSTEIELRPKEYRISKKNFLNFFLVSCLLVTSVCLTGCNNDNSDNPDNSVLDPDVFKFFQESGIFYLATVDGNKPSLRPMGRIMEIDGKLSFFTRKHKSLYKQMEQNNEVAISCTNKDGNEWIRVTGKVTFSDSPEALQKWLEVAQPIAEMYKGRYEELAVCLLNAVTVEYHSIHGEKSIQTDSTWKQIKDPEVGVRYKKTF
jgi:uncharacterized pyridoxamine 5'-phosphate oxidase family protein